jgi:sigma-B regulation protein RsbU (phosphoserine phosphatase)
LIALAPFLLAHFAVGLADVFSPSATSTGYTTTRDFQSILSVEPGGPADRAGLRPGDRLISIDGTPVSRLDVLIRKTARLRVGDEVAYRVVRDGAEMEIVLVIGPLGREQRVQTTTLAAVGLSFLAVGILVVLRRGDTMAIVFYSLTLVFAFLFAPAPEHPSLEWNLFIKALYNLCYLLLPALFLHFFLIFPTRQRVLRRHPRLPVAIYSGSALLCAAAIVLDTLFLLGQRYELLPAMRLFAAVSEFLIIAGLLGGIASFISSYRQSPSGNVRRRLKIVLWGTLLGILPLIAVGLTHVVSPAIDLPGSRFYHLALFLVPASFAYAIVRYGLMDLEIFLKRGVVYAIMTALLAAIYLLIVEGLGSLVMVSTGGEGSGGSDDSLFLKLVSILIIALVFSPVRTRIQGMVDRAFYRDRLNYRETLRQVSEEISGFIELEPLVNLLARRVCDSLRVENAAIYLRGKRDGCIALAAHAGSRPESAACYTWNANDQIVTWAVERRDALPIERLQEGVRWHRLPRGEKQALRELHAALLIPLLAGDHLLGIMTVGGKTSSELHSNEEIALLRTLTAHASVAIDNALLHKEAIERARLEEELVVARRIQESFLPESPPELPGVELSALNVPCLEVGGDYYDFLVLEGHKQLGVAIGDASGKGVPAALLMASLQAAFHAEAEVSDSPARVLERMNRLIIRRTGSERFVTFFYGILDLEKRELIYANAGHNPPLLLRRDGEAMALDDASLLLGVSRDTEYHDARLPLHAGDLLVLYTDGVTDELNPGDDLFGIERLETTLRGVTQQPVNEILRSVYAAVSDFMGGAPEDDITLLGVRIT